MGRRQLLRFTYGLAASFWLVVLCAGLLPAKASAATVTINSPANGQEFSGNNFDVSGTTDPNSSVLVKRGDDLLKWVLSDTTGKWSASLAGLPDGKNDITVEVVKNPGYAYFASVDFNGPTSTLNQIRLSDNAINPNPGWPVTPPSLSALFMISPNNDFAYTANPITPGSKPAKLNLATAATPVEATGFPSGVYAEKGEFSADGTKYFAPYVDQTNVDTVTNSGIAIIDVATNTVTSTIDINDELILTSWRSPDGKIYAVGEKIWIINPDTNTIEKSFSPQCADTNDAAVTVSFSTIPSYEYYFISCGFGANKVQKVRLSDDSFAATWIMPSLMSTIVPSLDSSKLFMSPNIAENLDKMFVVDSVSGAVLNEIQLSHGSIGFMQAPDGQNLYVATPGFPPTQSGIDVINTLTNAKTTLPISAAVLGVSLNYQAAVRAEADVSVVLGVKTGGSLADTGAAAVSTTLLAGLIIGSFSYTYYDYRKHKKPLTSSDPEARHSYTYVHHLRTVSLPLLRYRVRLSMERANGNDDLIHKF